jgi:hypothetical protein
VNPLRSLPEYERFVYTLQPEYTTVARSTLVISRHGHGLARLSGDLLFTTGYRLTVFEVLTWDTGPVAISRYGYEVWRGSEKLYWYDSQPHPGDPKLAVTHPHHKHVPPDIKHHRIPAPGFSFSEPNLPRLIEEIEQQP